jgi:hypothetical protein
MRCVGSFARAGITGHAAPVRVLCNPACRPRLADAMARCSASAVRGLGGNLHETVQIHVEARCLEFAAEQEPPCSVAVHFR